MTKVLKTAAGDEDVKIAVVGSLNMDYSVMLEKKPAAGETVMANNVLITPGGKGANQAYSAGKAGASVQMIGRVGKDLNAEILKSSLERQGISTAGIRTDEECHTGIAMITLDSQAQNSIIVCPGANYTIKNSDVQEALDRLTNLKLIMLQLEIPTECVLQTIAYAKARNAAVFLDPAPVPSDGLPEEVYSMLDYIAPNAVEAEMLSGIIVSGVDGARKAAQYFLKKGVQNVIIKLGGQGVFATDGEKETVIPAVKVAVADTTAAGDTFAGAFCARLELGDTFFEAVRYANYASGLSVTKKGAQQSMPSAEEIEKFINNIEMQKG